VRRPHLEGDLQLDAEGDLAGFVHGLSCSMTRATRMSTLARALSTASVAAYSHDTGLVPMMSITL
jgi:hypothetical protein